MDVKPATQVVHWPGKDVQACNEHAAKLKELGKFMGFAVSSSLSFTGELCANCENEAHKAIEPGPAAKEEK